MDGRIDMESGEYDGLKELRVASCSQVARGREWEA
jgi:hypothetical protein